MEKQRRRSDDHSADASKKVEKKYRPWRSAKEVPAPLMVRRRTDVDGLWGYAQPTVGGIILCRATKDRFYTYAEAFDVLEQFDGSPAGQEE